MGRIVIVGAGLAGHRAAVALRKQGFDGQVVVIGDEPHLPYDRPPLSKQLLSGKFTAQQCFFPTDDLDVEWRLGRAAVGLDIHEKRVLTAGGGEVGYDGLIIATGRRARSLPFGGDLEGVYTLRSLDDAIAFQSGAESASSVAIIGAGFIGCEVAATLRRRGVDVTLIGDEPYLMPVLGPEAGERATRIHEQHGVRTRLGVAVRALEGTDRVRSVLLTSGERIPADLVLVAIGSVANTEWLHDSGLTLTGGAVVCDSRCMAVGAADVAVAGDVAAWPHPSGGGTVCIEHWTNARDMATVAAANLVAGPGSERLLTALPTCWSDQYDVKIKTAGYLRGADGYRVVDEDPARSALVVEALRDGALVGAIVFNKNRTIIDYQRKLGQLLAGAGV